MKRSWIVFGASAALVIGGLAARAQIVGNPTSIDPEHSVPERIPYRGYLERDGVPYNSPIGEPFQVRFSIHSTDGGTVQGPGLKLWEEIHDDVYAREGSFSAALGSKTAFTQLACTTDCSAINSTLSNRSLFQYPSLYLELAVKFPGETNFTTLSNRQQILSSPYAMTARQAENMDVSRNLRVVGSTTVAALSASGRVDISGPALVISAPTTVFSDVYMANNRLTASDVVADFATAGNFRGSGSSPAYLGQGAYVANSLDAPNCCIVQCIDFDVSNATYRVASSAMTSGGKNYISTAGNGDVSNDRFGFAYLCGSPFCGTPYNNAGGADFTGAAGSGPCW